MTDAKHLAILVVEDNEADVDLITMYLGNAGLQYELIHQTTIRDALRFLTDQSVSIVLLDLSLPDGHELSAFFEIHAAASEIPIVILTGNDDEQLAAKAVSEGAQDYLPKSRLNPFILSRAIRFAIERKQSEQRYIEIALEQERVHLISEFIRDVSHEFRTPLSIIATSVHLLEMLVEDSEREKHYHTIHKQVDQILKLVQSLITMSELDTHSTFTFEPTDVTQVISLCIATMQHLATKKSIELVFEPTKHDLSIMGDPHKFHLALRSLLDNAVRYTDSGGTIWIDVFKDEDMVVIQITDTGVGIPPDILPHIFKRFFRQDQVHTTEGLGLGLPIANAIIQRHHGQLTVKSTVGTGTIATIRVPASVDENVMPY